MGQELIRQIIAGREVHKLRSGCRFLVTCIADSSHYVDGSKGFSDGGLQEILERKTRGEVIGEAYAAADSVVESFVDPSSFGVVVDVTASYQTRSALIYAVDHGWGVVLANKKPLAGPLDEARSLYSSSRVKYESTVGAGQPVIATLEYLLDTNDSIRRIEGQLSGSLGYICGQLDAGVPFSKALSQARDAGFTEPDPREDLAGNDVMRKAIILGRTAGLEMTQLDVAVEPLFPEEMSKLEVEDFMVAIRSLDDAFAARVSEAAAAGNVLRYTASIEDGEATVGLSNIPAGSSLAHLKYVSFQTDRYDDEPLLIGGKGAGVGITAAGVVGDMLKLCRENIS